VSRALAAVATGLSTASAAAHFLPAVTGLAEISCAILGLGAGVCIGAVTFKMVQASSLALCIGTAAVLILYMVESKPAATPRVVVKASPVAAPAHVEADKAVAAASNIDAILGHGTADERVQNMARLGVQHWTALEKPMRQQMLVLGIGVAIIVLIVALTIRRRTTARTSAVAGRAPIGVGA